MSRCPHIRVSLALLCTSVVIGPTPLRADYIVCYAPGPSQSRISCEAVCQEGEALVQRSDDEWAGCGTEGPDCGTAWSEWEADTGVGGSVPPADPCPAGCWRAATTEGEFRTLDGEAQLRLLWQCQGVEAADQ